MFKNLTKTIAVGVLAAASLTAQQRSQTVAISTGNPALAPIVADVYGSNFSTFSLIGYVARVGSFNFGSGTIESVPLTSVKEISYSVGSFKFGVRPFVTDWQGWCNGNGTVIFRGNE